MSERSARPWLNYALGLLCAVAVLAAVLVVGPASSGHAAARRTAKAALGVVQSTVSGSGNLEPASQLDLGFKTGGTVDRIYVKQGQFVTEGTLVAALDPVPAEVTLEQSRAALQTAEAALAREQETDGEGSASGASANAASVAGGGQGNSSERHGGASASPTAGSAGAGGTSGSGSTASTLSPATREANIASARATVRSDELAVRSDEEALAATKLYAPEDGTIVSLSGQVGEVVSATGTSRASTSGSSSGNGSGSGSGAGSATGGGSGRSSASGSGAGGSSSGSGSGGGSAFAVLSDLSSMKLVAALSESEIHEVRVGQIATVTVEALEGRKLAAHVSEVATLSTSSSGVVSYDVTFTLDQMDAALKPGMSGTAEVVVKQEGGLSVPSSAISGGSVTVLRGEKEVRQPVSTGLAGNSSTIVLSGLRAGETVVLPQASGGGSSGLTSLLRSRLGGGGGGGGALGGGGGVFVGGAGGGAFFRGGGG
jgi:multidrug efflux pump subunit AcrA (membrane-fusion protein)